MISNSKYLNHQKHLTEEQLLLYKEEKMTAAEMHQVERHLLDCPLCSDALDGLSELEPEDFQTSINEIRIDFRNKYPRHRKKNKKKWLWMAVASIMLFISVSAIVLLTNNGRHKEDLADNIQIADSTLLHETEAVIAENIEDTIINHHIALNDPKRSLSAPEENVSSEHRPSASSIPAPAEIEDEFIVQLDEKTKSEISEIADGESENLVFEESVSDEVIITKDYSAAEQMNKGKFEAQKRQNDQKGIQETSTTIKGTVFDEEGNPLPGVNVIAKGTNKGTVTDVEGNYELQVSENDKALVYSFIGFNSLEAPIRELSHQQDIVLSPDVSSLSEVVVIGYGTSSSTSAVSDQKTRPKPITGMRKFRQYIKENLQYPAEALQSKVEGSVELEFFVYKNGSISEPVVVHNPGFGMEKEAVRLLKEGPIWQAATLNGQPVEEKVKVKIPFKLKNR